jgi:translation initiation factor 3 subunit G
VTYFVDETGRRIKKTVRTKRTVVKTTVNPRIAQRKQWAKFGEEKGNEVGPMKATTTIAENIVFRPVAAWKASNEDKGDEAKKKAELKNAKIKCRICQGDHFTTKCPFKDTMAPEGDVAPADMPDDTPGGAGGTLGSGSGGYVPPHLRGRGGAGEKMGGKFDRDDSATLRVTNVSEMAEEQDLRDMFSRYGHVTRVFLAKDRETGMAKGFAFVSYADRTDAAKACEKMDGCEYPQAAWNVRGLTSFSRFRASYLARRVCEEGLSDQVYGEGFGTVDGTPRNAVICCWIKSSKKALSRCLHIGVTWHGSLMGVTRMRCSLTVMTTTRNEASCSQGFIRTVYSNIDPRTQTREQSAQFVAP